MESPVDNRPDANGDGHRSIARSRLWPRGWWPALGCFLAVAVSVRLGWWGPLDRSVNQWAEAPWRTVLWNAAKVVFDVASPEFTLPITLALGVLASWLWHRWRIAADAAARLALVVVSVLLLKPLIAAPGPTRDPFVQGGAFPSGHTTSTVVCVALLLARLGRPRSMAGRVAVGAVVVLIVGVSVICLNFHYLSDVVGGVLLGLLIATVPLPVPPSSADGRRWRRGPGRPRRRLSAGPKPLVRLAAFATTKTLVPQPWVNVPPVRAADPCEAETPSSAASSSA